MILEEKEISRISKIKWKQRLVSSSYINKTLAVVKNYQKQVSIFDPKAFSKFYLIFQFV